MNTFSEPIVVLDVEDVEHVGFNPNMTKEEWSRVVRYMQKAYEYDMDIFWSNLRYACQEADIEPLNNEEDE